MVGRGEACLTDGAHFPQFVELFDTSELESSLTGLYRRAEKSPHDLLTSQVKGLQVGVPQLTEFLRLKQTAMREKDSVIMGLREEIKQAENSIRALTVGKSDTDNEKNHLKDENVQLENQVSALQHEISSIKREHKKKQQQQDTTAPDVVQGPGGGSGTGSNGTETVGQAPRNQAEAMAIVSSRSKCHVSVPESRCVGS